jgi:acetyl-CoA carboxylase biotin carboxyl carrier protein
MEFEQILQLIDHVSQSSLSSFQYEGEHLKLSMECGRMKEQKTCETAAACGSVENKSTETEATSAHSAREQLAIERPSLDDKAAAEGKQGSIVKSPLVGVFYAAPAEGADPFVKPGDAVKKGDVLAIVEAMKLMNEIESELDGTITEIYVKNGEMVEYGQPLFCIREETR